MVHACQRHVVRLSLHREKCVGIASFAEPARKRFRPEQTFAEQLDFVVRHHLILVAVHKKRRRRSCAIAGPSFVAEDRAGERQHSFVAKILRQHLR